jgi:hypothetical protein
MSYWKLVEYTKTEGKLVPADKTNQRYYKHFIESLKEGDVVQLFMSKKDAGKSLAQLAKLYKCIRTIALESGYTFNEVKYLVKDNSGLVINDEPFSFENCSVADINIAIQTSIEIGRMFNLNLE